MLGERALVVLGVLTIGAGSAWADADDDSGADAGSFAAMVLGAQPEASADSDGEVAEFGTSTGSAFGEPGSWRWALYGGYADDIDRDGAHGNVHWAAEYFAVEDFSVSFELGGLVFDDDSTANGDTAYGANFNILLRWYFHTEDTWALYVDGGAGLLGVSEEVPANGSNFNFTPQAGVGAMFDVGDDGARLMVGARWHHFSNARSYDGQANNPGRDSVMGYVGVSFPWGN